MESKLLEGRNLVFAHALSLPRPRMVPRTHHGSCAVNVEGELNAERLWWRVAGGWAVPVAGIVDLL